MENTDSIQEQRIKSITFVFEIMRDRIINEVPEEGRFGRLSVTANIIGTEPLNAFSLLLQYDMCDNKICRLFLGARRRGTDRFVSGQLFKGSNEEIKNYLERASEAPEEYIEEIMRLSKRVDEFYS